MYVIHFRHNLPESEPLSEYSEMPMTPLGVMPSPFRQITPQTTRIQRDDRLGSGSPSSSRLLSTFYPQTFVTNYNPQPTFVMQSISPPRPYPSPAKRFAPDQSRARSSPTTLPIMNSSASTNTSNSSASTNTSSPVGKVVFDN